MSGLVTRQTSTPPAGTRVLDCTGLTVTPGLIDAHVHLGLSSDMEPSELAEYLAHLVVRPFARVLCVLNGFRTVDEGPCPGDRPGTTSLK
ncbi:hypothetical protein GCM10023192_79690 [Amycolatopsis samaneae]